MFELLVYTYLDLLFYAPPPAAVYSNPYRDAFVSNTFTPGNVPGGATQTLAPESINIEIAVQPSFCSNE